LWADLARFVAVADIGKTPFSVAIRKNWLFARPSNEHDARNKFACLMFVKSSVLKGPQKSLGDYWGRGSRKGLISQLLQLAEKASIAAAFGFVCKGPRFRVVWLGNAWFENTCDSTKLCERILRLPKMLPLVPGPLSKATCAPYLQEKLGFAKLTRPEDALGELTPLKSLALLRFGF
jgi:hypothetical protein